MKHETLKQEILKNEIELIRSVLKGYPPSIARADAFRALNVIQEETGCSPMPTKVHPTPLGFEEYRPSLTKVYTWKRQEEKV